MTNDAGIDISDSPANKVLFVATWNAWKKALDAEQLPWPNFLDKGEVANLYNVKAIPAMFLMDANGKLIATGEDARGERLAKRLAEAFQ